MSNSKFSADSRTIPASIHDKFFKDIFRVGAYVTSLIQAGAPKALFEIVDWSTLRLEPQLIQASRQDEKIADLVFSVALRNEGQVASIILLFEHKSSRDSTLEKQMARNQFLMYLQDDFKSLIVPIAVIQDPSVKRKPAEFSNVFSDYSEQHLRVLAEYSLNFRCLLINVNELDRRGLTEETNIDAVVRAMSAVRDFDARALQDLMDRTRHVPAADRERIYKLVLGYVCDYNEVITQDDILKLNTKTSEEQQMVRSAVEAFREEGRIEGREEGREEGRIEGLQEIATNLLQKGMSLGEIVEVTKLSREQVESIRQGIDGTSVI